MDRGLPQQVSSLFHRKGSLQRKQKLSNMARGRQFWLWRASQPKNRTFPWEWYLSQQHLLRIPEVGMLRKELECCAKRNFKFQFYVLPSKKKRFCNWTLFLEQPCNPEIREKLKDPSATARERLPLQSTSIRFSLRTLPRDKTSQQSQGTGRLPTDSGWPADAGGQDGPSQMRDPGWAAPPKSPALTSRWNGGKGNQAFPVIFSKTWKRAAPSKWI